MKYSALITHIRQYKNLAQRTQKDYSEQILALVDLYLTEDHADPMGESADPEAVNKMVEREYPANLRGLPPARTPRKG